MQWVFLRIVAQRCITEMNSEAMGFSEDNSSETRNGDGQRSNGFFSGKKWSETHNGDGQRGNGFFVENGPGDK